MRLPEHEREAHRQSFKNMSPAKKAEHIWLYYKLPIILGLSALMIIISAFYRHFTKKEPVIYLGLTGVAIGEDMEHILTDDFILYAPLGEASPYNPKKQEVLPYKDLYLTNDASVENNEYAYASKMKILATVNAQILDVVIMNREAYDILSKSGYLLDLSGYFTDNADAASLITENDIVLEDNAIDYELNEASEHIYITEKQSNALRIDQCSRMKEAGFPEDVYIGIIANSPRLDDDIRYIDYIISSK